MKQLVCAAAFLLVAGTGFAQTDSTAKNTDTVKVGNFIIIKKNNGSVGSSEKKESRNNNYEFQVERRPRKKSNISTNWWIMDLGLCQYAR